jgi:hypothetical protein
MSNLLKLSPAQQKQAQEAAAARKDQPVMSLEKLRKQTPQTGGISPLVTRPKR